MNDIIDRTVEALKKPKREERDQLVEDVVDCLDGVCNGCRRMEIETDERMMKFGCKTIGKVILQIWLPPLNHRQGCEHREE